MSAAPPPVRPRRPVSITVIGWLFVVAGTLLLPVSGISLLMVLAGNEGTASMDLAGFFTVIVAPPLAIAAGIGLLRGHAWARPAAVLLLVFVVATNVSQLRNRRTTTETTVSPSGVTTTRLASPPNYHSVPLIAAGVVLIARLLIGFPRVTPRGAPPLTDPIPPVPKDEGSRPAAIPGSLPLETTPQQWAALALFVAILLAIASGMGWLVKDGLERDATWLPVKRASLQRSVSRQTEPATYWLAIGVYSIASLGTGGLALWMLREACRSKRR